jgi:hypothetical protein
MSEVKKQWITDEGYIAVILFVSDSHHNGYIGIPDSHPMAQDNCESCGADLERRHSLAVHGGITYESHSRTGDYPIKAINVYWLGFDCAHSGDLTKFCNFPSPEATFKDVDYVVNQLENLSKQLAGITE